MSFAATLHLSLLTLTSFSQHERIIPKLAALDSELLNGLAKAGFQTTLGPQNSGFIMSSSFYSFSPLFHSSLTKRALVNSVALEKAGGYYFDTGASGKIASGDIKVKQGEISHFDGADVHFKDGSVAQPDTVIFATGAPAHLSLASRTRKCAEPTSSVFRTRTGYTGFPDTVRATLGTKWTKNMSTVWSLDDEGELKYVPPGLASPLFPR